MRQYKFLLLIYLISFYLQSQQYPEFIKVEGGTYTMGDQTGNGEGNERPAHSVSVNTFSISKTEVTVAQYRAYCEATNQDMPEEPFWGWQDLHPIVNVTWDEAIKYTRWLSNLLDKTIRLPYEAEWEFAARGGNKSKGYILSGTNSIDDVWFEDNSNDQPHNVASKVPNELGLYDMSGNVWEWCLDYYDKLYYQYTKSNNPQGPQKGDRRVVRGGGYFYKPVYCRVTQRSHSEPDYRAYVFGFRVVAEE